MKSIQSTIAEYLTERNWQDMKPSDLAKSISIEAAELLELFQWRDMTADEVHADTEHFEKVRQELADVFIYCLDMAVILDVDAETIIREKLELVKRKYPTEKQ